MHTQGSKTRLATLCAALAFSALAFGADTGAAQSATTHIACPAGTALIGLRGSQGQWMDRIGVICGSVSATGSVQRVPGSTQLLGTGTMMSPPVTETLCEPGRVVTAFAGGRATYVNTVHGLQCSRVSNMLPVSGGSWENAFAQRPDGSLITKYCTDGKVATGIAGRAGTYVEEFWIDCGLLPGASQPVATTAPTPAPTPIPVGTTVTGPSPSKVMPAGTPVPTEPASGIQVAGYQPGVCARVDPIPTLRWQAAPNAASYQVELRNVTQNRSRTLSSTTTARSYFEFVLLAGNQYTWRVRALNAIGTPGPWAAERGISAVPGAALPSPCMATRPVQTF